MTLTKMQRKCRFTSRHAGKRALKAVRNLLSSVERAWMPSRNACGVSKDLVTEKLKPFSTTHSKIPFRVLCMPREIFRNTLLRF
jgi:hypothetical protein